MAVFRIPVSLGTVAIVFDAALSIAAAQPIDVPRSVLTQHNDAHRTGWYEAETQLAPSTVTPTTFGELYRLNVPGMISAQPLYIHGVDIAGVQRNVLYVATNENHIYAFEIKNPDDTSPPQLSPLLTPVDFPSSALLPGMLDGPQPCKQTWWKVGITSTPVIDPTTGTMYVVYRTGPKPGPAHAGPPGPTNYALGAHFWLAAVNIRTFKPIQQAVEIKDPDFASDMQLNRPALLLAKGILYIAFGEAVCDYGGNPYIKPENKPRGHGWVFAFDASDISRPPARFDTTQNTSLGGIWQSGNGLSVLGDSVFAMTGNNGLSNDPKAPEYAESLIKLTLATSPSGGRVFEKPAAMLAHNWYRLDTGKRSPGDPQTPGDSDLGSGGPVSLPNGRIIGGGKQGRLYVVDPSSLTQTQPAFQAFYNTWHPETDVCDYDEQQQNGPNIHGSPVAWHPSGLNYSLFYGMPEKEYLKGFRAYDDGHVNTWPDLTTTESGYRSPDKMPGGFLSISSNGGRDGIVWALVPRDYGPDHDATYETVTGRLIAFDAHTLRALWSDDDTAGANFVKFVPPTIADGKVFRASYQGEVAPDGSTNGTVIVYGAKASQRSLPSLPMPTKRLVTALWDPGNHHLHLFTPAADGEVLSIFFHAYTPEEHNVGCVDSWRGWFPVTDQRPTTRGFPPITAVWRPNHNHLDLFTVGDDGAVKSTYLENGRWAGWFSLRPETGKAVPGQPITAVWRDANHLDLFMTDSDGHVRSINFENDQWQPAWFTLRPETGRAATGQPITALWRPGRSHLDLFMTGDDGFIKSIYFENDQWQPGWFTLRPETGRAAARQPVTAVWRDASHLDLFMTGNDGFVRSIYFDGTAWQPAWFSLRPETGRAAVGQPITALWRPGSQHLDLFMVQDDGYVKSLYFESNAWQPAWFSLRPETGRATVDQPITAVWRDQNHLDLFMTGNDGRVKSIYFEHNAWQPAWFSL